MGGPSTESGLDGSCESRWDGREDREIAFDLRLLRVLDDGHMQLPDGLGDSRFR